MITKLISRNNSKKLYVLFLGWGMDERPILPLIKQENVLMIFDARHFELNFDFTPYEEIYILAFSYGVMEYALLSNKIPNVKRKIALNGTLCMKDEQKGLPLASRKAMRELSLDNYLDFRKNFLLHTEQEFIKFNENAPLRTIEDCIEELDVLEKMEQKNIPTPEFDCILISKEDKTIPTQNQLNAWQGKNIKMIKGNHFALYQFESLCRIFDL